MTVIASASQNPTSAVVKEGGAKGVPGNDGIDGTGFNNVRKSLLDNPLASLFKKNSLENTLSGSLLWTRASPTTITDRYGVVKDLVIDQEEQNFSGWQITAGGQNDFIRSEEFDNVAWIKSGATITANATAAPDEAGSITADKIVHSAATSFDFIRQSPPTPSIGDTITTGVYASPDDWDYLFLRVIDGDGVQIGAWFDLANGAIGTTDALITARMSMVMKNGFYRCSISHKFTSDASGSRGQLRIVPTNADGVDQPTGTGVEGVFIWGAYSNISTGVIPYQETIGSPVAFSKDIVKFPFFNNIPSDDITIIIQLPDGLSSFTGFNRRLIDLPVTTGLFSVFARSSVNTIRFGVNGPVETAFIDAAFTVDDPLSIIVDIDKSVGVMTISVNDITNSAPITEYPDIDISADVTVFARQNGLDNADATISGMTIYDFILNDDEKAFLGA